MYSKFIMGKNLLIRAKHNDDLLKFILKIVKKENITTGSFTAIGALKRATLGFYDQDEHKYRYITFNEPTELVSCIGNISLKENQPFIHTHAVLTNEKCEAKGGHLTEGIVFSAEIYLQELLGEKIERKFDEITSLSLWDLKN